VSPPNTPVPDGSDPSAAHFAAARRDRVVETGIVSAEDRLELAEDFAVLKIPRDPPHDGTIQRMLRPLLRALPPDWDVRVLSAVALSDSRPEPDFAIVREDPACYTTRHPRAGDVGCIIEVANDALLRDEREKARIYARGGIPTYWIVNLVDRWVEVYGEPSGPADVPGYGSLQLYQPGDAVPLTLDDVVVATLRVDALLP
jgi:Uma2 family endonuclease